MLGSSSPPLQPAGSALDPLLEVLAKRQAPQRTLDALALITAYESAGVAPLGPPKPIAPSEPDPRNVCSPLASGHFVTILTGRRQLLLEWLELLNAANLRLQEESVPALLDAATEDRPLRPPSTTATGPLGVWLSQFRPEWSWIHAPQLDESVWETGTLAERLELLSRIRRTNPARGRELIASTWSSEPADSKRQFLEILAAGASLDDEDFLETLLDDRSIVVRRAAAESLGSLAGSKLSQRAQHRLANRIRLVKSGLFGMKKTVDVVPFEDLDAAALRDTVDKKPSPETGLGERAWWTARAIASIDPTTWNREFNLDAGELLEAAKNGEWKDLLLEGWRVAAIRHRNSEWLMAFAVDLLPASPEARPILAAMNPRDRETALTRSFKTQHWLYLTPSVSAHPWSLEFTEAFIRAARETDHGYIRATLRDAAFLASPQFATILDGPAFAEFNDILTFRRAMRQALGAHPGREKS